MCQLQHMEQHRHIANRLIYTIHIVDYKASLVTTPQKSLYNCIHTHRTLNHHLNSSTLFSSTYSVYLALLYKHFILHRLECLSFVLLHLFFGFHHFNTVQLKKKYRSSTHTQHRQTHKKKQLRIRRVATKTSDNGSSSSIGWHKMISVNEISKL